MRIHAVWSERSLYVDIYYSIHWLCKRTTKAQISLRISAGWSGPALSANCIRTLFVRCASYEKCHIIFYHIFPDIFPFNLSGLRANASADSRLFRGFGRQGYDMAFRVELKNAIWILGCNMGYAIWHHVVLTPQLTWCYGRITYS